jgi:subtilisin family serine protease
MVRVGAVTLGGAIAATLVCVAPAGAAPPPATPASHANPSGLCSPPPNPGSGCAQSTVVSRHTVTLLTGDVVQLTRTADGKQAATVQPPADRLQISYQSKQVNGHAYVIPSDAVPMLAAGKLDERLFDITQLVADGYDDAHVAATPLIVQYAPARTQAKSTPALPGTRRGYTLESINANAVRGDKAEAKALWTSLVGSSSTETKASLTTESISHIWLDSKVRASLAESVPQIGAPQAWAAGHDGTGVKVAVLDTGIDTNHPDLTGKVVAAQNFSTDTDTADHFGHGTHVASIVAGSGAASNGLRKGVAPGASLVNAKVLNSGGSGESSSIIEGMEWAAAQGARIANMSLGTHSPSDGNDPLVQAVDEISRSTGMLFVIAADNIGPGDSTITSPGWADDALTVGAVDKRDALADFSSRGPRLGDYGIKPDLTAPGVDIVAALAEGTTPLGPVVDDKYMQISGTSMAAPHAAGAAAILAQARPGYTNQQLKNLLISTAKTMDDTVYRQGGGRLDVARAHAQQVYATPGTLNLGYFPYPHTGQQPATKNVTYRNDGATEVTLSLSLTVTGKQGQPAPAGMFTLSQSSVTVPAGGEASVSVTVDPQAGALDLYGGHLVGTSGDTVVHTSVGANIEQEMYNITVPALARDGRQADGISQVELWGPGLPFQTKFYRGGVTPTFRVPPGTYSLMGYIFRMDEPNLFALDVAVVGNPQLKVTGDATVTLDARPAKKIDIRTQKPSAPLDIQVGYHRKIGDFAFDSSFLMGTPIDEAYAVPGAKVTEGDFEFWSKWTLIAPTIQMSVVRPQRIALDPLTMINSPPVDGTHRLPLVYAGFGQPEDYTGIDVRGKIALVSRGAGVTFRDKVLNAANAGATAVIVFNNVPGLLFAAAGDPGAVPIPGFTINQDVGLMLVDMLSRSPLTVEYSGTSRSGYEYDLFLPNEQRIAPNQSHVINDENTARINATYHGNPQEVTGNDIRFALRPWTSFLFGGARPLIRPQQRTEWTTADPEIQWWAQVWANAPFDGQFERQPTAYKPGRKHNESWFRQVARPGIPVGLTGWENDGAPAYREGDAFQFQVFPYVDPEQHYGWGFAGDTASTKLYQGDQLLAESTYPIGTFPAVSGNATYRLVTNQHRSTPWWQYSTDVNTTWTFRSAAPATGRRLLPLVQAGYDLSLDSLNRAPGRSRYHFTLNVGHQPGVNGPDIRTVQAWVSYNDGGTWKQVSLVRQGGGKHLVRLDHPRAENTSGAVSLRVKATDSAGNGIDQTIIRAYGLS